MRLLLGTDNFNPGISRWEYFIGTPHQWRHPTTGLCHPSTVNDLQSIWKHPRPRGAYLSIVRQTQSNEYAILPKKHTLAPPTTSERNWGQPRSRGGHIQCWGQAHNHRAIPHLALELASAWEPERLGNLTTTLNWPDGPCRVRP